MQSNININIKQAPLLDYVIVNQIMMLLLWRLHYSMAPIVVMMSVCGNKLIAWTMETLVIGGGGSIGALDFILSLC